jgi:hypothetical protein
VPGGAASGGTDGSLCCTAPPVADTNTTIKKQQCCHALCGDNLTSSSYVGMRGSGGINLEGMVLYD